MEHSVAPCYLRPMARKIVSLVVLTCIMLHCANRMQMLSYLYEHRYDMAHAIGVMIETPIALCGADYDATSGLALEAIADAESQAVPPIHFPSIEIIYYPGSNSLHTILQAAGSVHTHRWSAYIALPYTRPSADIFAPPRA